MRCPAAVPALLMLTGVTVGRLGPDVAGAPLVAAVALAWVCSLSGLVAAAPRCFVVATGFGFLAVGTLLGATAATAATETTLGRWHETQVARGLGSRTVVVEGRLVRDAAPTDYGASLYLTVERLHAGDARVAVSGGIRIAVSGQLVADRIDGWTRYRRVRIPMTLRQAPRYGNPGVPDQQRALMWRGTSLLGSVKSGLLVEVVERGSGWAEATAALRAAVRRIVDDSVGSHSPRSAGIVTAVLIGDRAGLDRETQRRLQEGGTYHVIAISGGNIAILSGVLLLALQLTGVSARPAALVTIGCLLAYAQVVGSEASVARATFAAATFLAARAVDHRSAPLNTVALSASCLLAVSPLLALDAGFLLTFGATLGILVGVPPILSRVRPMLEPAGRWGQWLLVPLLGLFAATVCAELALVPVAAAAFSRVTIAGLALNFVAIPLMAVAQLAGMCAVGGGLVMSELAAPFGYIAHGCAMTIRWYSS